MVLVLEIDPNVLPAVVAAVPSGSVSFGGEFSDLESAASALSSMAQIRKRVPPAAEVTARAVPGSLPDNPVAYATVRDAGDELHVECRFKDGQKYAGVVIDNDEEGRKLAAFIVAALNGSGSAEWQLVGEDEWDFGVKVRGAVREPVGEIYFDKDRDDARGGWVWLTHPGLSPRGVAPTRSAAMAAVEAATGSDRRYYVEDGVIAISGGPIGGIPGSPDDRPTVAGAPLEFVDSLGDRDIDFSKMTIRPFVRVPVTTDPSLDDPTQQSNPVYRQPPASPTPEERARQALDQNAAGQICLYSVATLASVIRAAVAKDREEVVLLAVRFLDSIQKAQAALGRAGLLEPHQIDALRLVEQFVDMIRARG